MGGTDQQRQVVGGGGAAGAKEDKEEDRISALPDDLLRAVLVRLGSAAEAARTSVLSRRWRHVWAHLPELTFYYGSDPDDNPYPPPWWSSIDLPPGATWGWEDSILASFSESIRNARLSNNRPVPAQPRAPVAAKKRGRDRIGEALAAYSAPSLRRLDINDCSSRRVTAKRVSAWLRFASPRLAGALQLSLPNFKPKKGAEIVLPLCERVTSIALSRIGRCTLRFQLPPWPPHQKHGGAFKALTALTVADARVDSRELSDVLTSRRCPRLKELRLERIILKDDDDSNNNDNHGAPPTVLSVRCDSLQRLEIQSISRYNVGQIQVAAPALRTLGCCDVECDFHMDVPKLSDLRWGYGDYDPSRQHIAGVGHTLRRLDIRSGVAGAQLMQRFGLVHELSLNVSIAACTSHYKRFMEVDMKTLAKCDILVVSMGHGHGLRPIMIHLLRKCSGVRKLEVHLSSSRTDYDPCKFSCPCNLLENRKVDNRIVLDSLEEVEVKGSGDADHKVQVLRVLCSSSERFQRRVAITVSEVTKRQVQYIGEKISRIVPPNGKVEVTVRSTC